MSLPAILPVYRMGSARRAHARPGRTLPRHLGVPMLPALVLPILVSLGCAPEGRSAPGPGDAGDTIRVLAYNIHHGEGMDSLLDLERIAALIRSVDPDLVALQEVDSVTTRTGAVDQAAELARLTGMDSRFGRFMPYRGGAYGMAILSRWPVRESTNLRLPEGAEPRSALSVVVQLPGTGRSLRFVGIHLYRSEEERMAQAVALDSMLAQRDLSTLLAGDFNSTPDSPVLEHLARSWTVVSKGDDRLTYPSFAPEREIDFVLLRTTDEFEVVRERVLDEPIASDHRPVLVDLVWNW